MVSDKDLALWFGRKEFPESRKTSKVFIRRIRVQYMWIDTGADSESHALVVV